MTQKVNTGYCAIQYVNDLKQMLVVEDYFGLKINYREETKTIWRLTHTCSLSVWICSVNSSIFSSLGLELFLSVEFEMEGRGCPMILSEKITIKITNLHKERQLQMSVITESNYSNYS